MQPLILGVDPGSQLAGFGLIQGPIEHPIYIQSGVIRLGRGALPSRLHALHQDLLLLIQKHRPSLMVLERAFVHKNPQSALVLGHARGVCLLAAESQGLAITELAPASIKKLITGKGSATKADVQTAVKRLLHIEGELAQDASDALAMGYAGLHHN